MERRIITSAKLFCSWILSQICVFAKRCCVVDNRFLGSSHLLLIFRWTSRGPAKEPVVECQVQFQAAHRLGCIWQMYTILVYQFIVLVMFGVLFCYVLLLIAYRDLQSAVGCWRLLVCFTLWHLTATPGASGAWCIRGGFGVRRGGGAVSLVVEDQKVAVLIDSDRSVRILLSQFMQY